MKKTIIFFIVTLLICSTLPLAAAEKLRTIVSGDGAFFYTKPYHPVYRATSKFIPDLLYPEVLMSLTAHVKIPAKTKLSPEVSDFLDKIFTTSKNPAIRIDDWASEVLEKCFSNIENKTLPNVAKIFEKTSATNPVDVKKREAAVKSLNEEFLKTLKGIEKNKFVTDAVKKMKTAIINEVKSAKKTTLTGLDVTLTLSIMSKEAPTERTGILNKLANVNKARETFFANQPKFIVLQHLSQAKFPRIPNIIYFDFPCAYINFPETPDFKILAELPGNLGERAFFFVHHGYPLREMRTETESFAPSKVDNKLMLDTFYKYSQKYGKMLFSSQGMTTEDYQKLNKEFTAEVLAHKAVIADKIKNSLKSSLLYQNPAAKGQLTLIEDEKSGYTMSDKKTDISLADPENIDTEESVGEIQISNRLKKLLVDIKHLSEALKKLVAENVTFTKNFHDFMLAQKPVKNKEFTKFFQTPALKKHLDAVSMMDQKRAHEFINNLGKLEDVMDQAKTLWTMADMMEYLPEYKVYAHKGEPLKALLASIVKLQFFWKAAKVYTYDTHLHLDLRLKEIVSANKADENQGFEYLLNWSDSIHSCLLELKKFPESFVESFENNTNNYLNFDTDEPVKLIGGSK